ncbi:unnamed protein product [Pleuronectes platessa]|uniref:Uncharacterized protein n=1 Tax=Pleuronectes platessa TaxID=8262 RepID=A0A9N7TH25_PLEPL|nr:unnamed protein product [Pleuronectes platessa]
MPGEQPYVPQQKVVEGQQTSLHMPPLMIPRPEIKGGRVTPASAPPIAQLSLTLQSVIQSEAEGGREMEKEGRNGCKDCFQGERGRRSAGVQLRSSTVAALASLAQLAAPGSLPCTLYM